MLVPNTDPPRRAGFHGQVGFRRRPALLVVDMTVGFTDPASPLCCDLDATIPAIDALLSACRRGGLPVFFTTVAYGSSEREAGFALLDKLPALAELESGSTYEEIDPRLAPAPGEVVVRKLFASGFFGTALLSRLVTAGVDTLIVTGASTSGCVRATVVDAVQHGFRVIVPAEAVGDREAAAHEQSLHDIDSRYGDVISLDQVLSRLLSAERGELPLD